MENDEKTILKKVMSGKVDYIIFIISIHFRKKYFVNISDSAIDLIHRMLTFNYEIRISASNVTKFNCVGSQP